MIYTVCITRGSHRVGFQGVGLKNGGRRSREATPRDDDTTLHGGLTSVTSSLSDDELEQLKNPELWQPPETLDKVAQLVRSYLRHPEYGEYVEAEPNYELARIKLGIDPSPYGSRIGRRKRRRWTKSLRKRFLPMETSALSLRPARVRREVLWRCSRLREAASM